MKLLYCRSCRDSLKLQVMLRTCRCGAVSGSLVSGTNTDKDLHHANVYGRSSEVIGIGDVPMLHALNNPDLEPTVFGVGPEVHTWLYPHNYDKITRHLERK